MSSLLLRADRRAGAGPHRRCGGADGGNDVLVPGAPAEVALDGVPDLVIGRIGVALEQVDRGHDHARRAEPALEAVLLPECVLHRMELIAGGDAFDGPDAGAIRLDGEHRARLDRSAVHLDRARPALARVAPDVCAGHVEVLTT